MSKLPNFREEKKLWRQGYSLVIGVDEVGRGAFAGPVIASACAFAPKFKIENLKLKIDDSKRLKPQEREKAAAWIKKNCLGFGIGEVGVATINKIGIGRATTMAMRKAITEILRNKDIKILSDKKKNFLSISISQYPNIFLLVDAFYIKYLRGVGLKNQKAIIKGDQKSISIAAASILAKVYRDTLMRKFTKRYKEYRWKNNKGYGTKKHQEAILERGLTPFHRRQFVETFLKHYATL